MYRKIIPNVIERRDVCALTGDATVLEAAQRMADENIAAIVVIDADARLVGIVTERDMSQRVLARELDAKATPLAEIMTENPDTLAPDDSAADALELMRTRNYRHLPVAEEGRCVGMVSIRDLYAAVKEALEENIRETEAFVFGDRYVT